MFDAKKLLDQFLGGNGNSSGLSPDLLKGAAAGGIVGILLGSKGGRRLAKSAAKIGGVAILGSLAYNAYKNWQAQKGEKDHPAAPSMKDVTPAPDLARSLATPPSEATSLAILRAMIAAAKADGHIDAAEQKAIFGKLDDMSLDAEAKAFVVDEMRKPLDIDSVVAGATTPEIGVGLYTASVMAIDPDDSAEQAYLSELANRLKLDPGLKTAIEAEARKVLA